ncbi:MAG: hypothetical protein ACD_78C00275G0001, partial [uncultured bacterium (gcode 4)]
MGDMKYIHEFLYELFFFLLVRGCEFVRSAGIQVTLEYQIFRTFHKSERCVDLLGYVHTISIVFHHLFHSLQESTS